MNKTPVGYHDNGFFNNLANDAYFWSSSHYDATGAWGRRLGYDHANVCRGNYGKTLGFSGRCLKE